MLTFASSGTSGACAFSRRQPRFGLPPHCLPRCVSSRCVVPSRVGTTGRCHRTRRIHGYHCRGWGQLGWRGPGPGSSLRRIGPSRRCVPTGASWSTPCCGTAYLEHNSSDRLGVRTEDNAPVGSRALCTIIFCQSHIFGEQTSQLRFFLWREINYKHKAHCIYI